jgi:cytoskeleton protein RodZ
LCIKPVYLAAIEQGRTEELPGPTYAIGFIRAYATYLGLDGERVLDSYREEKADVRSRPDLTLPVPLEKRGVPGGKVLLTGLVVALCGYGAWYYVSTGERERPERVAAVPAELQQLTAPAPAVQASSVQAGAAPAPGTAMASRAPPTVPPAQSAPAGAGASRTAAAPQFSSGLLTPPQSAAGTVAPDSPSSSPAPTSGTMAGGAAEPAAPGPAAATGDAASGNRPETASISPPAAPSGNIDIRALADSWVQIRASDQEIVFARVLKAGESYRVPRSGLILRTGNAGALEVLVDGKPAPSLGALGTLRRDVRLEPEALRAGTAVRG